MASYIAIIHKDEDSDYGVSFPDFPGCITAGRTLDEARTMAAEALSLHIQGMSEDGAAQPEPSTLDEIAKNPDFTDGVAVLVDAPRQSHTLRVNITISSDDLTAIDSYASRHGMTRSGFLVQSALKAAR
ncbi:MAG: type II toxin-antitoxin system HicB family antitoxin [Alphaproteobacteria bacterium]